MRIGRVLVRRLLWVPPVAFGVVTLTFFGSRLLAGDPTSLLLPKDATDQVREALKARLGLSQPLVVQYWRFLRDLVHGNLGTSYFTGHPVTTDLFDRLPASLEVGVYALVLASIIGIPLGVYAALHRDQPADVAIRFWSLGGLALPAFWISLVLIWVLAVELKWLPGPSGRLPVGVAAPPHITGFYLVDSLLAGRIHTFWLALRQLILPVGILTYTSAAPIIRMTRNAMIDALDSEYIRTAVAMGHHGLVIPFNYALRNALLPVVTTLGGLVGFLFAGEVLVEGIFSWPGIGQYALQSINNADFPALQGFVIYTALINVVVYAVVDVVYVLVDPRTRR